MKKRSNKINSGKGIFSLQMLVFCLLVLLCCSSGCSGTGKVSDTVNKAGETGEKGEAVGTEQDFETKLEVEVTEQGTTFIYGTPPETEEDHRAPYKITQLPYPTFWGGQAYSILTPKGDLYLIDGGFIGEDGDRISSYIEEHGGKVKGWILTHPHVDHIGAFLDFMEENSDRVETVYYAPFTKEFFEEEEDPEIYAILNNPNAILFYEFLDMKERTEDSTVYLPFIQGDRIEIGDLLLECHSSFDPKRHDVNGNSLAMTLSYRDFCMALTSDITEETLADMEEELPADSLFWNPDILQIPHHGYMAGIASNHLYQKTEPEYALLDCTVEEYENNSVNIQNHAAMIEELEIKVIRRFDAEEGNRILIYPKESTDHGGKEERK